MSTRAFNTAVLVAVVALAAISSPPAFAGENTKEPCCFTNPRYAGVCEVQPGEDETCASILSYLNSMNSAGKTYCGGTTVRGGWTQASCDSGGGANRSEMSKTCNDGTPTPATPADAAP